MSSSNKILERLTKLHPKIIDLSLDRVISLLAKLKNPHEQIPPVIHIAGTNGKGSTLSFLKAGFEADNKTVHSYTSPHLVNFNERISLNGEIIDESILIKYLETCEKANQTSDITFFEITTCAAFMAFSEHKADYTLLEVGLGGRLDATNVIKSPVLSIITPISLDHEQFLGNSILEIATEKAGILKPGVPVIIGKQLNEVETHVCSIAANIGAPISLFGSDWAIKQYKSAAIYEDNDGFIELPLPKLEGQHQIENAGIAITALKLLKVQSKALKKSMEKVKWSARLQKLTHGPLVQKLQKQSFHADLWIDGGHNQAAAKAIASFLDQPFDGETHLIIGMLKTKDFRTFISEILPFASSATSLNIPGESSSLSKEVILNELKRTHSNAFMAKNVSSAINMIIHRNKIGKNIRILCCGSLYLCGYILRNHN